MNRKVRTALYACALMAPLILQSCKAAMHKVKKKRATKSALKKQTKTLKKRL